MSFNEALDRWFKRIKAHEWAQRHTYEEPQFSEYVIAIGRLLLAWNDLHERLASLFVMALGGGVISRPLALWKVIRNDGGKRAMLQSALIDLPATETEIRPKLVEEIMWLLDKTQKLEGHRDDAAHTPLDYWPPPSSTNALAKLIATGVFGHDVLGHEKAERINKSQFDFLTDLRYAHARIILLRDYALAIDLAWGEPKLTWPDRPELPNRLPKSKPQPQG